MSELHSYSCLKVTTNSKQNHHIFFNKNGYHNHIAHHLLTLYGLGAPSSVIEQAYKDNLDYQRKPVPANERVIEDLSNSEKFNNYLGNEEYYHDFLIFFQKEMEKKGWEEVLNEYVFKGDERADDLFGRLYAGELLNVLYLFRLIVISNKASYTQSFTSGLESNSNNHRSSLKHSHKHAFTTTGYLPTF